MKAKKRRKISRHGGGGEPRLEEVFRLEKGFYGQSIRTVHPTFTAVVYSFKGEQAT